MSSARTTTTFGRTTGGPPACGRPPSGSGTEFTSDNSRRAVGGSAESQHVLGVRVPFVEAVDTEGGGQHIVVVGLHHPGTQHFVVSLGLVGVLRIVDEVGQFVRVV